MSVLTLNHLHDITGNQIMKKVMKIFLVPPLLILT